MKGIFVEVLNNKYVDNYEKPLNNYFMIYTTIEENIIKINIAFIDTYSGEDYLDESQIKILSNLKKEQIKTILEYIKIFEVNLKLEVLNQIKTDDGLKLFIELIKKLKIVLNDLDEEQIKILSKLRNCINKPNLSGGYKFKKYKKRKLSKKNKKYKKRKLSKKRNISKKRKLSKKRNISKKKK